MSNFTIIEAAKKVAEEVSKANPSLNNSACLMALPTISYPTGKKTLTKSETLVDGVKVAGEALNKADLDWFPQDKLAPFNTIRKAAKAAMIKTSVEVGGLYIVAVEKLPELMEQLMQFQNSWDAAFNDLVVNYENWLEQHRNAPANANLRALIDKCSMTVAEFTGGFRFAINPAMKVETLFSEQSASFSQEVALSLWDEVAKMAEDLHKNLFQKGQEKLSQKGLFAIRKLRNKLVNLSFIHDGVEKIVARFDEVMSGMPKTGPVENTEFYRAAHMVLQFTSAARLKAEADGLDGIESYDEPEPEVIDVDDEVEQPLTQSSQPAQTQSLVADAQIGLADNVNSIASQLEDEVVDPGTGNFELDWTSF